MLERLEVRSLGIIDRVELELEPGFSVLTGETGAGKSLLIESLKLLSGQRSQSDLVRSGDDRLRVEGAFAVPEAGDLHRLLGGLEIPIEGELVLRREVAGGGRSRCWINDVSVTATTLQQAAPHLLAIHGQHEQHGLAEPATQRRLVDDYAGNDALLGEVAAAYGGWQEASLELGRLRDAQSRRRDRLDVVSFQLAEIEAADPRPEEDADLVARRQVLRHAVRILELSTRALGRLADDDEAVIAVLAQAEREVAAMTELGLALPDAARRLSDAAVQVAEVADEVRACGADVAEDPAELENVESRLYLLEQLMLKYGSPIDAVLAHRDRLRAERSELLEVEDRLTAAEARAREALDAYAACAERLDAARRRAAEGLVAEVEEVLGRLNMAGTRLEFAWRTRADVRSALERDGRRVAFDELGVEECELLIAANPGEEPRPMARIASGGELSRLHLALRTVLLGRRSAGALTLLFDEVDSGLGGATAAALAGLLADLATEHQVLVVTHLPQVAARAGSHYRVEKVLDRGRAVTRASRLDEGEREGELARMLSGDEMTDSARAHARALLGEA